MFLFYKPTLYSYFRYKKENYEAIRLYIFEAVTVMHIAKYSIEF